MHGLLIAELKVTPAGSGEGAVPAMVMQLSPFSKKFELTYVKAEKGNAVAQRQNNEKLLLAQVQLISK